MGNPIIILELPENGVKCQDGTILYPELPYRINLDSVRSNVVSGTGEIQEQLLKSNDLLNELRKISHKLKAGQRLELNLRAILYNQPTNYEFTRTRVKFTL